MIQFGLASHSAVRWLIGSEKQIYDRVIAFYMGHADTDVVEVAGPPTDADLEAVRKRGHNDTVPLPVVRLIMKLGENMVTGEHGVEVKCSDADLEEIKRWELKALLDSFKAKGKPQ